MTLRKLLLKLFVGIHSFLFVKYGKISYIEFWSKQPAFHIASNRSLGMQSNDLERSMCNSPTKFLLRFFSHRIKMLIKLNYLAYTSLPVFR